jgi:hypothetical protein
MVGEILQVNSVISQVSFHNICFFCSNQPCLLFIQVIIAEKCCIVVPPDHILAENQGRDRTTKGMFQKEAKFLFGRQYSNSRGGAREGDDAGEECDISDDVSE